MKKYIIPLVFLFVSLTSMAQNSSCGHSGVMNQRLIEEPSLSEQLEVYEQEIQSIISSRSFFTQKKIPVVIHIIYNDSYSNISNTQVYSALTAINEDFNANNSDFNQVVSAFSAVKSDVELTFVLASKDPQGNSTNGITRTHSDLTDSAGENVKGLIMWDPDMYLNIWIVDNIESGAGAYAYYPGTAPAGAEGIVCRHTQFGTSGTSSSGNYNSTTLTHEIGHYLNLPHTWGSTNDPGLESNCDSDDGIDDTPNTIGNLYGCNTSQSTCGSLDNVQNFMDYTSCTNMFTEGQRTRMHAALHSSQGGRVNLWQYENLVATGVEDEQECTSEEIIVQINTGSYANEISWVILDEFDEAVAGGGGVYSNTSTYYSAVCLEVGAYTFQAIDSYGDGWNGGSYAVYDCNNTVIVNQSNPSGSGTLQDFDLDFCNIVLGCTDYSAWNYDSSANEDDGSCIYSGCTDIAAVNYEDIASIDDGSCEYEGCTDPSAYNYDELYTIEDGSCTYEGCTDYTALNYNPIATIEDGTCNYMIVPDTFSYTITGVNHTLILPQNLHFYTYGNDIEAFDIIGVFYEDENGMEHCAGYQVWHDTINSIAVQGDDLTSPEIDGCVEGEPFIIKLWDNSEQTLFNSTVLYNSNLPNLGNYTTNGISQILSAQIIIPITSQTIELPQSWSIFSSYLSLDDMNIVNYIAGLEGNLIILKDFEGMAYIPEWGYNGIGDAILGHGYQLKLASAASLNLTGTYISADEVPIILASGWNMLGYLRDEPASAVDVFESISTEINMVKDYLGNVYLPDWNFNGIGNMEPGRGYQVKMNTTQTFYYNSNEQDY